MTAPTTCYPLEDTGFIAVSGPDATAFLHAQLAIDVLGMHTNGALLAPWLNAKGRVTALFSLARHGPDEWLLATDTSLVAPLTQRLGLFVLRAAVQIADVSASWRALAVRSTDEPWLLARCPVTTPPGGWTECDGALWRQTLAGIPEVWGPKDAVEALQRDLPKDPETLRLWQWALLSAGIPDVTAVQQDHFTAHMLNLDLLDALSFDKGCYPGQEIVARTQNLGRPKRRTLLFETAAAPAERGAPVVDAQGNHQGEILRSVAGTPTRALAVVALTATGALFLHAADGPSLKLAKLPYPIPEL